MKKVLWLILLSSYAILLYPQRTISIFVFFNRDRERIHEQSFLENDRFEGAQLKYTWAELEPAPGKYDFSDIESDLAFLQKNGKKLFIQIQDVSFDESKPNVPEYLLRDPIYGGGVEQQYITDDKDDIVQIDGFVAKRWNPEVRARFKSLLEALGRSFDGKIEGINLPETAVGFGDTGQLYPADFTPEKYRDALIEQMDNARRAFPKSIVIQYANFMPGEWLPWNDRGYLESLYLHAKENDIGMGGPDIKIYKKAQMNHSYRFLKAYAEQLTTGMAVQWGNYEEINPKTGKQVTVAEIYQFAKEVIDADYIFWCTQEPYYSRQLPSFLKSLQNK